MLHRFGNANYSFNWSKRWVEIFDSVEVETIPGLVQGKGFLYVSINPHYLLASELRLLALHLRRSASEMAQ